MRFNPWQNILSKVEKMGVIDDEDEQVRLQKSVQVVTAMWIGRAALIWGLIYYFYGEYLAGSIPITYSILTFIFFQLLKTSKNFRFFSFTQILTMLLLPFFLLLSLGGFVNSSVVIVWGFFAPIIALLSGKIKVATYWFLAYLILILAGALLEPLLRTENNLPEIVKTIFFIINIGAVSTIVFLVLNYFVKNKDKVIDLMRTNRELELAYLQQEVMLRQNEKLATLGRLSAGLAHELNNPAAAAQRGSKQLQGQIPDLEKLVLRIGMMNLSEQQLDIYSTFKDQVHIRMKKPTELDPISRSDRETEIESWLKDRNVSDAWDIASMMVCLDFAVTELSELSGHFSAEQFQCILSTLLTIYATHNLLDELGQGTGRITEIVRSLKSYSYMDKAPLQSIDVHEGINDTLVMLRGQLKDGITVQKEFDEDLPAIQAYGSELNQVWTNIIDNAIAAMNGKGTISILTTREELWLVIRITDSGPGIPKEIIGKVFDPFFTTKAPGEGTGLGLNISHNIIVQKHKGKIRVQSGPEGTSFEVKLPIDNRIAASDEASSNPNL
jgi:signal transduction histidine kinase